MSSPDGGSSARLHVDSKHGILQGKATNSFLFMLAFWKNYCFVIKANQHSCLKQLSQLPRPGIDPLKGFLSFHGALPRALNHASCFTSGSSEIQKDC